MKNSDQRVLVIGLDGATFDIIDPLIRDQRLPHLASLIRNGTRSRLKSTLMPNSFPSWSSCVTGVNPGKHGIFWSLIRTDGLAYPLRLMNSFDIQAETLWTLLGNQGYQMGVINVPTEYPPTPVNGFVVCGAMTPREETDFTYPKELRNEILGIVPDYKCEVDFAQINLQKLATEIIHSIENREKLLLYLLQNKRWDLLFMVFTETDLAQHKYWAGIDAAHPKHTAVPKGLQDFVYRVYERIDESIGKVLQETSEETSIFVVSDHGFGPFYQSFSLSQWLVKQGYLVLDEPVIKKWAKRGLMKVHLLNHIHFLKDLMSYSLASFRGRLDVRHIRNKYAHLSEWSTGRVDWKRTRAYSTADLGIRINLKTREPLGTVPPGPEEDSLKERIKGELGQLKFSNGQPVFEAVQTKEEAFSGPFLRNSPDLIVPINHAQAPSRPEGWDFTVTLSNVSGAHSPMGILIASGKGIRKGEDFTGAEVIDITPTILYIFGERLTEDMDGKVLFDIFDSEFRGSRSVAREGSSIRFKSKTNVFSEEEERELQKKLRDLGYIE